MIGFAILLKNIRRVEKLKKGSRAYAFFLHFWKTLNHSWHLPLTLDTCVYVSVLVCVRNDLYVKLLNKTNICGEHEGSQEPVIQHVNVYNYVFVYVHVHLLHCVPDYIPFVPVCMPQ